MKKQFVSLTLFFAITAIVTGCKKGENDPFLSLHSRKARVVGEWKVSSGEGTRKEISMIGSTTVTKTTTWSFDGTNKSESVSDDGSGNTPTNTNSKFTITYEFYKEGKFKTVFTDNNNTVPAITITEGIWNFTDGIGDEKKKSSLMLRTHSVVASTGNMTTYEGTDAPTEVFELDKLKNKEMVVKSSVKKVVGANSDETQDTWVLKQ